MNDPLNPGWNEIALNSNEQTEEEIYNEIVAPFEGLSMLSDRQIARMRDAVEIKNKYFDAAQLMLKEVENVKLPQRKILLNDKNVLTLFLSDDHIGKKIYGQGHNVPVEVFNSEIGEKRIDYYFDEGIQKFYESPNTIDTVVIVLAGDHIEGDGMIHKKQAYEIEFSAAEQFDKFLQIMIKNLVKLSEVVKGRANIKLLCVPGNHGDVRKNGLIDPRNNFDLIIYMMLKSHIKLLNSFGVIQNIDIDYPHIQLVDRQYVVDNIKGWNFYVQHIFQNNLYTPTAFNKIHNLNAVVKGGIDIFFTGHLHSEAMMTINNTTIIRTPSLTGYDDYAHQLAVPMSNAMHPIIITSQEKKIKEYIPVELGHIK